MTAQYDVDEKFAGDGDDRAHLIKVSQRLTTAFHSWAVVVGIVGTVAITLLTWILIVVLNDHADLILIKERQNLNTSAVIDHGARIYKLERESDRK